jgi:hypothetical protein
LSGGEINGILSLFFQTQCFEIRVFNCEDFKDFFICDSMALDDIEPDLSDCVVELVCQSLLLPGGIKVRYINLHERGVFDTGIGGERRS